MLLSVFDHDLLSQDLLGKRSPLVIVMLMLSVPMLFIYGSKWKAYVHNTLRSRWLYFWRVQWCAVQRFNSIAQDYKDLSNSCDSVVLSHWYVSHTLYSIIQNNVPQIIFSTLFSLLELWWNTVLHIWYTTWQSTFWSVSHWRYEIWFGSTVTRQMWVHLIHTYHTQYNQLLIYGQFIL